jgi:hypothetical protein
MKVLQLAISGDVEAIPGTMQQIPLSTSGAHERILSHGILEELDLRTAPTGHFMFEQVARSSASCSRNTPGAKQQVSVEFAFTMQTPPVHGI